MGICPWCGELYWFSPSYCLECGWPLKRENGSCGEYVLGYILLILLLVVMAFFFKAISH